MSKFKVGDYVICNIGSNLRILGVVVKELDGLLWYKRESVILGNSAGFVMGEVGCSNIDDFTLADFVESRLWKVLNE